MKDLTDYDRTPKDLADCEALIAGAKDSMLAIQIQLGSRGAGGLTERDWLDWRRRANVAVRVKQRQLARLNAWRKTALARRNAEDAQQRLESSLFADCGVVPGPIVEPQEGAYYIAILSTRALNLVRFSAGKLHFALRPDLFPFIPPGEVLAHARVAEPRLLRAAAEWAATHNDGC